MSATSSGYEAAAVECLALYVSSFPKDRLFERLFLLPLGGELDLIASEVERRSSGLKDPIQTRAAVLSAWINLAVELVASESGAQGHRSDTESSVDTPIDPEQDAKPRVRANPAMMQALSVSIAANFTTLAASAMSRRIRERVTLGLRRRSDLLGVSEYAKELEKLGEMTAYARSLIEPPTE